MDQSSQVPYTDVLFVQPGDLGSAYLDEKKHSDGSSCSQISEESLARVDDRGGQVQPTVDVAEIIRRWTHALQRIHKQSLQLAKANDGEGPDILSTQDGGTSAHVESLASTLTEHQQHLASFQVFIKQLKEVAPVIQKSISDCTEKVNSISSNLPPIAKHHGLATSSIQPQGSRRTLESSSGDVAEVTSKMSTDKVSASPPTLKLPQLLTPNSFGKGGNIQKCQTSVLQTNQIENLSERNTLDQPLSNNVLNNSAQDRDSIFVQNLKRSVRESALSVPSSNSESSQGSHSDESSEHFFVPLSAAGFSYMGSAKKASPIRRKRLFVAQTNTSLLDNHGPDGDVWRNYTDIPDLLNDLDSFHDFDQVNGFLLATGTNGVISNTQRSLYDIDEPQDQIFSPPMLMETSLLADSYEDLLAPLCETETALMEH